MPYSAGRYVRNIWIGPIIEKPCSRVYYISGKGTSYATVMSKAIEDLYLFELEDLKNSGYFIDYTDAQMALNGIRV
mgnify:CR=1 FL=1